MAGGLEHGQNVNQAAPITEAHFQNNTFEHTTYTTQTSQYFKDWVEQEAVDSVMLLWETFVYFILKKALKDNIFLLTIPNC